MTIPTWQPGTTYAAGAIVIPATVAGAQPTVIPNADFDAGDTDWTKETGWAINQNLAFSGAWSAEYSGPGAATLVSSTKHAVKPGKSITASCFVHQGASDDGQASAAVILEWYDGADQLLSTSTGNAVSTGEVGIWRKSTVSAVAPPNSAKVAIGCSANNDFAVLNVDNFAWNYVTGVAATGLAYKNVGETGTSGLSEPDWPLVVGGQVADPPLTGDPEPPPPADPPADPPGQASSPNPSNGASGVDVAANLFWSAGADATSHNVYFGTVNPPGSGQLQGNQLGTSFDPGTMAFSTTYYWRIDEVNVQGTTAGSVWSFTTEADPGPPPDPEPPSETELDNPGFEEGSIGWTSGPGYEVVSNNQRSGSRCARWYSTNSTAKIIQSAHRAVTPGTSITGSCYIKNAEPTHTNGRALLRWYDENNAEISTTFGGVVSSATYARSTVGGTAPMGAAYVAIGCEGNSLQGDFGHYMYIDDFDWNY